MNNQNCPFNKKDIKKGKTGKNGKNGQVISKNQENKNNKGIYFNWKFKLLKT